MVNQHFDAIDAEYCLAEGGNGYRTGGSVRFVSVQTLEKIPYAIELIARGPAGHGSVPLENNAVAHVAQAVANVAKWPPPVRLNETTSAYFKRLSEISPPAEAARYRDVLDPKKIEAGRRLFPQERAAARVDAAHVGLAQHHSRPATAST